MSKPENQRPCLKCNSLFEPEFEDEEFCSGDCEDEYDQINNEWRFSNYEWKNIGDWTVDDHLAAYYDDMMEKQ